jgi:hypothetical protein
MQQGHKDHVLQPHKDHKDLSIISSSLFASLQRVFVSTFVGRKCVIKQRFSKEYRHPLLLDAKLTLKHLNVVSVSNQHVPFRFFFNLRVKEFKTRT